jgi:flavin reductase (DIM6/NTAB) family NADH-FMN oxidoreductase RutF
MIVGAQAFGVNWVQFPDAKKVGELGETSAKEYENKLSAVGFTTIKGEKTSQPLIQEASATLECRLREKHLTGTHQLVIAEVVAASATEDFSDYWDFTKYNPLLYAGTLNGKGKSWMFMSGRAEVARISLKHQT